MGQSRALGSSLDATVDALVSGLLGTPSEFIEPAPAVGVSAVSWMVPAGVVRFKPLTVISSLVSDATPGSRIPGLGINTATPQGIVEINSTFLQSPSDSVSYFFQLQGFSRVQNGSFPRVDEPLVDIFLQGGDTIIFSIQNLQAGDQLGGLGVYGLVYTA